MNNTEYYCENCGKFIEGEVFDFDSVSYCPICNCDMRGEENENEHSFEERIKDGFNFTKED